MLKINNFWLSRYHFTFMFGGQFQLNVLKSDMRNISKINAYLKVPFAHTFTVITFKFHIQIHLPGCSLRNASTKLLMT